MEVLFSDYKFRVGEFNPDEEFDFDATTVGKIEARKGTPLAEELFDYWRNRRLYNGQPVTRILGGELFFSGMAITGNRANGRSLNSAVASLGEDTKKDSQIASIMKAIASKNKEFDMSKCEIIDGQPSCNCLEQSIAAQLNLMLNDLKEITVLATNKRKAVAKDSSISETKSNMMEDMDEENDDDIDINQLEDHLKEAQLLLQNLYENNIDNELSSEEIRKYLENIDNILNKTSGLIKK